MNKSLTALVPSACPCPSVPDGCALQVSPSTFNQLETISTLQFASRAKNIQNKPRVNKEMNISELQWAYRKAQEEIMMLKDKLSDAQARLQRHSEGGAAASSPVRSGVRGLSELASRQGPRTGDAEVHEQCNTKIQDLEAIIASLKAEIQELKQELLDKATEIHQLKEQVPGLGRSAEGGLSPAKASWAPRFSDTHGGFRFPPFSHPDT